jgi:dethiobiotin synthetase/adenosylmethionine--8-amino-7-oxononanoate aminotransferase
MIIVEGAGGVHSPTPSGTSQLDALRPLRLPIFLVGDPNLGGISGTISAWESEYKQLTIN